MSRSVKLHATLKLTHVLKFVSFVDKNNDVSIVIKCRVFDAALTPTVVYGCEAWIGADLSEYTIGA